jgi:hypothetical protein
MKAELQERIDAIEFELEREDGKETGDRLWEELWELRHELDNIRAGRDN